MSRAIDFLPNYTYSDYLNWEGRWELINGIPFAMSPAPAPKHQKVVAKLMHLFLESIENIACVRVKLHKKQLTLGKNKSKCQK
jgi:hypothetical protein